MKSQRHVDILLNRHACNDVVAMVTARSSARAAAARIVTALPPGIQQRTPEWHAARKGMLTASEFKIAGAEKVSQAYVNGKVFPHPFTTNDAMTLGEPLRGPRVRDVRSGARHEGPRVWAPHPPGRALDRRVPGWNHQLRRVSGDQMSL
jgi:hypothetical protein